jgi:hypothetical protein
MIASRRFPRTSSAAFAFAIGALVCMSTASGRAHGTVGDAGALQEKKANVSCEMAFTMSGWSAIVSKAEGKGVVTCNNGQRADVVLSITGGGLTVGKTQIDEGKGVFSDVANISEIFGSYAQAAATAGAVESVSAQALTKGPVSLAITTKGRGWSLGVQGASFSIERAANAKK